MSKKVIFKTIAFEVAIVSDSKTGQKKLAFTAWDVDHKKYKIENVDIDHAIQELGKVSD